MSCQPLKIACVSHLPKFKFARLWTSQNVFNEVRTGNVLRPGTVPEGVLVFSFLCKFHIGCILEYLHQTFGAPEMFSPHFIVFNVVNSIIMEFYASQFSYIFIKCTTDMHLMTDLTCQLHPSKEYHLSCALGACNYETELFIGVKIYVRSGALSYPYVLG